MRLTTIDKSLIGDHRYLRKKDDCAFLGEFTARQGFDFSETNNKIFNLKKPIEDIRERPDLRRYKNRAIAYWGKKLSSALAPEKTSNATWVIAPTSKLMSDPNYDDRLSRLLSNHYSGNESIDIRNFVITTERRNPAHLATLRPTPTELAMSIGLDNSCSCDNVLELIIFDDVITKGTTFRVMSDLLTNKFPDIPLRGIFLARTVHLDDEFVLDF